jgi:aminoglycoside phosphotransferase family enzyme
VPLTADAAGHIAIGGNGEPIDWLVRMRRLPAALSLEHCLAADTVGAHEARRIVGRLVPFFAAAAHASITPPAYRRRLWNAIADAAAELVRPAFGLMPAEIAAFAAALSAFVAEHGDLLDARVDAGRIVEGHGDLRPEHIYLTEPPTIMDCIEFDRSLRLRDPVDELAFLAMECERSGRPELDAWLFAAYRELAGDDPPRAVIEYYKAHNAFVRARIAIWHLDDPDTGPPQHWVDCANDYLDHTRRHLTRLRQQLEAGPEEIERVPRGDGERHEGAGLRPAPRAPR